MKIGDNMDKEQNQLYKFRQRVIVQFSNGETLDFDAAQVRLSKNKEYLTGIMVEYPRGGFISKTLERNIDIKGDFFINMRNTTITLIIPSKMSEESSDE
jgi:hypothetical protein